MINPINPLTDDNYKKQELSDKLQELKLKEIEKETQSMAIRLNLPYINLRALPIPPETLRLVSEEDARNLNIIPFLQNEQKINLAIIDPNNPNVLKIKEKLQTESNLEVVFHLTSPTSITLGLKLYQSLPQIKKREKSVEITEADILHYQEFLKNFDDLQKELQRDTPHEIITLIVAMAIKAKASDIHIEAEENDVKIRFRIDGILNDIAKLPKKIWPEIVSWIKLISSLKINVSDQPQDGHFSIFFLSQKMDVRVSTIPSSFGESVVIRLLMMAKFFTLEELGFRKEYLENIKKEVNRPNGIIVITGPTGAGKTTTLYAILSHLNNPEIKIITLEDPIEYELPGVTQTKIDTTKGQTFAKNFRSIMRQDPDIIMVGEIRDQETAEVAIQAALTGHLVFSTIHTNDAAGVIPRFLVLGAKPYLLAPALDLVIAQRLVRKICNNCRQEKVIEPSVLARVKDILIELPDEEKKKINLDNLKFYEGTGCEKCHGIGYQDRIGIFEFFEVSSELEKLITQANISEYEFKKTLAKQHMLTMAQDGLLKALDGITTVDEVFRVTDIK